MSRFLDEKFSGLEPYVPGEQPQDMKYIKLNTNESPFPPSEGVFKAVNREAVAGLRLYPDPEGTQLREKIAAMNCVKPENVYLANGSDDILNFAFMAFCTNKKAYFPDITYGFYKVFAELNGIDYSEIRLGEDFSVDAGKYAGLDGMIVIANPNAPTGLSLPVYEIERIVVTNPDVVVLVDEAYVDFGGESCVQLTKKYDNLLVVQTFSKSRCMAGARLGFAIASRDIIADLEALKYSTNPYNINRLTLAAGAAAIDDNDYYMDKCREIQQIRADVTERLEQMDFDVVPSSANFIFIKSRTVRGWELYFELKRRGVLVRHFDIQRIRDYNRVTIGDGKQMEIFINTVREILTEVAENDKEKRAD